MADDYESDSSGADDIETNVVLGYASLEPTGEAFSQLGGHPTWLDGESAPSGAFAKCKVCNSYMSLLLQIRGDLEQFPTHERRLYLWTCRRKACRRKEGCIRGFRATRRGAETLKSVPAEEKKSESTTPAQPVVNLGDAIFGVKSTSSGNANPFSTSIGASAASNPFSAVGGASSNPFATTSSVAAKPPQRTVENETLSQTFAQKARIASQESSQTEASEILQEAWPPNDSFPKPFPPFYIDPSIEYIVPEDIKAPSGVKIDREAGEGSSSAAEDKAAFESTMDKTFQKFADRLAQNAEQVLRYEFGGQPLLYSKSDAVGKALAPAQENSNSKVKTAGGKGGSRMPRCTNCGAERMFETQLTPAAIENLEMDDSGLDGMDWGTIILGVCSKDCQEAGKKAGEVGYIEEWIGVQWEELSNPRTG